MSNLKKILSLTLAVLMLASVLSGCGLFSDGLDALGELRDAVSSDTTAPTDDTVIELPTEEPTEESTEAPTEESTEAPTEAPTEESTEAPTEEQPLITDPDSCYWFYDYAAGQYVESNVVTYQGITGAECQLSALDWGFLQEDYENMVVGYDESYGVFLYEYAWSSLERYFSYLESVGFEEYLIEEYQEGTSYYYYSAETGFYMDIFVANDSAFLVIEPYLNADPA